MPVFETLNIMLSLYLNYECYAVVVVKLLKW